MKRVVLIVMLMCVSFTMAAQDDYKNSVSIGLGSVVSAKMESFSPTVDVSYRRDVLKGLGMNVGYRFKHYDTKGIPIENENTFPIYHDVYDYNSSSVYFGIDYRFKINNICITPLIGAGYDFMKMYPNETNGNYSKELSSSGYYKKHKGMTMFSGINIGYEFERFVIFCSYNYDFPQINTDELNYIYTMDRVVYIEGKEYYYNGDIKFGVAFKF